MGEGFVIRYAYPGTKGGRPVGDVYVTGPHNFGGVAGIYSHTYDPAEASRFTSREAAERLLGGKSWRLYGGRVVALEDAPDLKDAATNAEP